jgi:haloalkane dehalogenase
MSHDRIAAYFAWLKTAPLPKLFIDAEPGVFITGRIRRLADEIGQAIARWLERI